MSPKNTLPTTLAIVAAWCGGYHSYRSFWIQPYQSSVVSGFEAKTAIPTLQKKKLGITRLENLLGKKNMLLFFAVACCHLRKTMGHVDAKGGVTINTIKS